MRLVLETGPNFSAFLAARLIFVSVLLGIPLLYQAGEPGTGPYLTLIAINSALSLGCWEWFRRQRWLTALQWFALSSAVIVDTLVLRYTGGSNSEFVFLYFFSVGSAGLLTGLGGSLWAAGLASAGVVWLDWSSTGSINAFNGLRAFGFAVNFALTAVLSSYIYGRFAQRERRHRETLGELERTKLDTQAILDSLGTGLVVLNPEHRLLYTNPAGLQILGVPENAATEEIEATLRCQAPLIDALEQQASRADVRSEMMVETQSGPRPVGFSVSSLELAGGESRGHIVLFSDLTRVKELEREERQRDRLAAVGLLSRDLAHEIRNPLATVRGCVEMLSRSPDAGPEQLQFFNLALKESDRLNGFLSDFLTFARLEAPHRIPGDLRALIRESVRAAELKLPVDDRLDHAVPAEFDADQLSLVIDTILLTLAEWGEAGDTLRIEALTDSPCAIRLGLSQRVISKETRENAFRPFSGVQRRSNGLALPTAMRAVHAHGGTLQLESGVGVGTYFEMCI